MNRFRNVEHLETIFIEKLSEKFKLNERDLKKAFVRFDKDKNGLLDIDELKEAVKCYVSGAPEDQVDELMKAYDRSGDNKISYEELLYAMETRSATKKYMKSKLSKGAGAVKANSSSSATAASMREPAAASSSSIRRVEGTLKAGSDKWKTTNNSYKVDDDSFREDVSETADSEAAYEGSFDDDVRPPNRGSGAAAGTSSKRGGGGAATGSGFNIITNFKDDLEADKVSEVETFDDNLIENKVKSYLKQLKLYLSNSAKRLAYTGSGGKNDSQYDNVFGIATSGNKQVTKTDRLTNSHADLISKVSRDILLKAFEPYTGPPPFTKYLPLVNFSQFSKALRSLVIPGIASLRTDMLEFLFDLVVEYSQNPIYALNTLFRGGEEADENGGVSVVDVRIVLDVFLGDSKDKLSYVDHCAEGRSFVGSGPIKKPTATEANNSKLSMHVANLAGTANNGKPPAPMSIKVAAPLRFVSRRSRACLTVPTGYDEDAWMKRSSQYPDYTLVRDHVFGMSESLQSGNSFYLVPPNVIANGGGGGASARRTLINSPDSSTIIYPAAAVGVVHDLGSNKQFYFDGHTDDITAFTCSILSASSILVATGTCGKYPELFLWKYDSAGNACRQIGLVKSKDKVFSRSVTLIMLSSDCNYMFAIGGDDHHTMFVFSLRTVLDYCAGGCVGELVVLSPILETSCQSGIPPMVTQSAYCPYFDYCDYIDRDHAGVCDVFCTVGERHIRIWSFKRPDAASAGKPSLKFRSPVPGKVADNLAPKTYTCCAFIPPSTNPSATRVSDNAMGDSSTGIASCDLVTGGSNGAIFLYRSGAFISHNKVIKGGVSHITCMGDKLVVGGAKCVVKIVDAKTLAIVQTFDGYNSYALLVSSISSSKTGVSSSSSSSSSVSGGAAATALAVRSAATARPSSASMITPRSTVASVSARRNSDAISVNGGDSRSVATSNSSRTPSSRPGSATSSSSVRRPGSSTSGSRASPAISASPDMDDIETVTITGMSVIPSAGSRASSSSSSSAILVTLSSGVAFKMDISANAAASKSSSGDVATRANRQIWTASEKSNNPLISTVKPVFYFHTKDICGVATDTNRSTASANNTPNNGGYMSSATSRVAATTGDDRRLCIWNMSNKSLLCRTLLEASGRCCYFDRSNCFVAVGCSSGAFYMYAITPNTTAAAGSNKEFSVSLVQKAFRKDSQEEINDIKISPNNTGLVAGSRDNHIYVYNISLQNPGLAIASVSISPVLKLSGHTSFIRQMDYSSDGKLLLSTCGAHELLCWQLPTPESAAGGLAMGINISDINWKTNHCIFGFPVMGIWPTSNNNKNIPYDGTDINAIDVCREKGLVVVADDFGKVSLLNYPCIIENAPSRVFTGHSSHVSGIRVSQGYDKAISIGGHDRSAVMWRFEEVHTERAGGGGGGPRRSAYNNML